MTARVIRRRRVVLVLYALFTITYLLWRAAFTLNPAAPLYAWCFLALETYAAACALAFYLVTLERHAPAPPPARPGWRVDVLICTYNEEPRLLRQTIRRALAMDYPHRTYVLDDGRRDEVRALAAELGCAYLTRPENTHHKAGNLNHALGQTDGELLVVLDADHLVRRDFLRRLVGHFDDPRVAVVQTPQVFYNIDSFQHHLRGARMWHEGAIFHHAMQPGADRWNAAFFVGTGAILRRAALAEIGGFATESVTEDAFTCMRLHAAGWRSVYHDEPLGYLLAPESLHQYLTQRLRWGQGSLQILRLENPLTRPGLTWRQRLVYFSALSSFAQAIVHLVYYLAPAIFLLGGPAPLRAETPVALVPLVLHIAIDVTMFKLWLGPLARPLLGECYKLINLHVFLKAPTGYFRKERLKFQVTTKGRDAGASARLLAPQAALLLLNVLAVGVGVLRLANAELSAVGLMGIGVALFFSGLFTLVGGMTFLFARDRLASGVEYTFPDSIPAQLAQAGGAVTATAVRANEREIHVLLEGGPVATGTVRVTLELEDGGAPAELHGQVIALEALAGGARVARIELGELGPALRDRLFDRLCERAMPRVIDPLVLEWSGRRRELAPGEAPQLYLPVQTNVL
jgi:cellulose synthase (UDP-forming)